MSPIEIFEYKQKWQQRRHYRVQLHSDLHNQGKEWCKVQLMKHQWDMKTYTNVYEHTFLFEHRIDLISFLQAMPEKFINQPPEQGNII